MRVLFLDTETNGLPQNRYAPYTMIGVWPSLCQIAWQVWDMDSRAAAAGAADPVPQTCELRYTSEYPVREGERDILMYVATRKAGWNAERGLISL